MTKASSVRVGCTFSDPAALAQVRDAIWNEAGQPVALTAAEALSAISSRRIDVWIWDMEPASPSSLELIRRVHMARPELPVWLYYSRRTAVIEPAAEAESLQNISATPQLRGPLQEIEIRAHLRRLLSSVPRIRLVRLVDRMLCSLPAEVREYLVLSLEHRDHTGPKAFKVRNGAATLPGRLRHLQRVSQATIGVGPKRLLDGLILTFLTFKAFAFDVPLLTAAEQAGLSHKALHELRRRVLGADVQWAKREPRAQFEFALMAFAKVCKVSEQAAGEIVEEVAAESLA